MKFYNFIFQAWKVLKFRCGSWKVMENQYTLYSSMNERQKDLKEIVEKLTDESKNQT